MTPKPDRSGCVALVIGGIILILLFINHRSQTIHKTTTIHESGSVINAKDNTEEIFNREKATINDLKVRNQQLDSDLKNIKEQGQ
jgi:hypothetical protein